MVMPTAPPGSPPFPPEPPAPPVAEVPETPGDVTVSLIVTDGQILDPAG